MNIFFLHKDPVRAARMHCDQHVIKMPIESTQMLSAAFHANGINDLEGLCGLSHLNHPSTVWVRQSRSHYAWLYRLYIELCAEYEYRYGRKHESLSRASVLRSCPDEIPSTGFSLPPLCMPEHCKQEGVVKSYRTYYLEEKARFARWTRRRPPVWWPHREAKPDVLRKKRIAQLCE